MRRFVETTDRIPERFLLAVNGLAGLTVAAIHVVVLTIGDSPDSVIRDMGL